jgi:hypothetical protein
MTRPGSGRRAERQAARCSAALEAGGQILYARAARTPSARHHAMQLQELVPSADTLRALATAIILLAASGLASK